MSADASKTANRPLLDWLLQRHPDTPKTRAKQWILAGRVSVNGVVIGKPQQLIPDPGAALELGGRHATTADCGAGWSIHPRVELLFLDDALAVVNKAPGLLSVPAPTGGPSALGILADFLAGRRNPRERGGAGKLLPPVYRHLKPMPVHRLDQYTSGVFCLATSPAARQRLIEQVKAYSMTREYVAFAEGRARLATGTWRNWLQLGRDELRQHVVQDASAQTGGPEILEAITHYEVVAEYPLAGGRGVVTQLRLRLETGRKHQIRVQAAHAGLPLVGDRMYHPGYREAGRGGAPIDFPRQALHAATLSLEHPWQPGARRSWTAAWPNDLRQLEAALRAARL
jgi:23S rRNA pseudouridine1911/1915/1917 synthase